MGLEFRVSGSRVVVWDYVRARFHSSWVWISGFRIEGGFLVLRVEVLQWFGFPYTVNSQML